jgi:hypothetical protein
MAAGDFADLQLYLARDSGRPTAADLDDDLSHCKSVINQAYLGCYAIQMPDGSTVFPPWARESFGLFYRAPVAATLGVTQGSKVVTGHVFNADQVGSTVQIGSNTYTYAGLSGSDETLVDPVLEATGTYSATIYHESQPIDAKMVRIIGLPERKGYGLLSPMTNRETEINHRSNHAGDFYPTRGSGYYESIDGTFGGVNFSSGPPLFFRFESGSLLSGAVVKERLCLYPAPDRATVVRFDANVIPTELSADADRPRLKGDLVTRIMLPIARFEWASTYKKYSGTSTTLTALKRAADQARSMLATFSQTQTRGSGRAIAGR